MDSRPEPGSQCPDCTVGVDRHGDGWEQLCPKCAGEVKRADTFRRLVGDVYHDLTTGATDPDFAVDQDGYVARDGQREVRVSPRIDGRWQVVSYRTQRIPRAGNAWSEPTFRRACIAALEVLRG